MTDLRYAIRNAVRNPGFTVVVVLTLALGIGANTAIFSVVRAVLIDPLPYHEPDRLVMVWEDASHIGFPENTPAPANYADWKAQNTAFAGMAALGNRSYNVTGDGEPERLLGLQVTYDLFAVLGVKPMLGRVFTALEDRPGSPNVALLGHALWQQRYGASREIVGRKVLLDGVPHEVIGVMPPGFDFPQKETSIWTPAAFSSEVLARRGSHFLRVVARLKDGVTLDQARADMDTIARRLARDYPATNRNVGARVIPLHWQLVGRTETALVLLLAVAGAVLLIACANIANLLLARAVNRRRELGVRIALGAGRARLLRQLVVESLLLSGLGAGGGGFIAAWSADYLSVLIPENMTSAALRFDLPLALLAAALCALTTILFGALPARHAWRVGLAETLSHASTRSGEHRSANRLRAMLVVSQTALAAMLLVAGGLLLKTFANLRGVDPGFRAEHVLTMRTALPASMHVVQAQRDAFYQRVLARVQSLPGVVDAGYTTWLPYTNYGGTLGFLIEGRPDPAPGEHNDANVRLVSPGYFRALGMTLVRGRLLAESDARPAPPAVVINQTMARMFWQGEDPIGRRFRQCRKCDWMTVVGLTRDLHQRSLDTAPRPEFFLHYSQLGYYAPQDLAIRATGDLPALANAVRGAIWEMYPQQTVAQVKLLTEYLDEDLAPRRFQSQLLGAFAGLALLLASVGIYGVLSYSVAQRRREIGVRMALGAQSHDILRLVVGQGLRPALTGLAIGIAAASALANLIASLLFGVEPRDPLVFSVATGVLLAIATLACLLPARRAGSTQPMEALRE